MRTTFHAHLRHADSFKDGAVIFERVVDGLVLAPAGTRVTMTKDKNPVVGYVSDPELDLVTMEAVVDVHVYRAKDAVDGAELTRHGWRKIKG